MKQFKLVILSLLLSLVSSISFGQYTVYKKKKSYLALLGGFNYSIPHVTDRYAVLSASSAEDGANEKEYGKLGKNKGVQFGIRYSYNFTNTLSVVAGFGYQTQSFNYRTDYAWADTVSNQSFEREMHHKQQISYFTLPVLGRWDMTHVQFKPYLQAGIFMDFRHQASKIITYDNTIDEEETENQVSSSGWGDITENTRKFNMGVMAGVGVHYYTKYITLGLETNFRYGFLNTINDKTRYADQNGFALEYLDVLDQLKLGALNVQFSVSVPINNSITANILRKSRYNRRR
ncbi:MAG: PorT family protein [Flavobacteriales bacterium]|nr:PorT family protein [Flavobacteriales bacterium]